jgi:hypothetical protein
MMDEDWFTESTMLKEDGTKRGECLLFKMIIEVITQKKKVVEKYYSFDSSPRRMDFVFRMLMVVVFVCLTTMTCTFYLSVSLSLSLSSMNFKDGMFYNRGKWLTNVENIN